LAYSNRPIRKCSSTLISHQPPSFLHVIAARGECHACCLDQFIFILDFIVSPPAGMAAPPASSTPWLWIGIGIGAALLVAAIALFLCRRSQDSASSDANATAFPAAAHATHAINGAAYRPLPGATNTNGGRGKSGSGSFGVGTDL
jgi:hypothetical protein